MSSLFHIVVLPSAKADVKRAADWYEAREFDLGKKFKNEIVIAIDSVLHPVRGYGSVYMGLSRVFGKKFPYVVYFKTDERRNTLVVYAVLHQKQNQSGILEMRI